MKKDNNQTRFLSRTFKFVLYTLLIFSILLSICRFIDRGQIFNFRYGHYHFPVNQKIPFFRQGEREFAEINEFGFRIGNLKEKTSCSYVLLGDSQTFGSGIFKKDSFPEILNRETDCHWINLSIPGFTLENEFSMYEKVSPFFPSQDVYLFVYGNDIYETGDTPDYLHFVNHKKWHINVISFFFPESTRLYLKRTYFESIQKRMEEELERVSKLPYSAPNQNEIQKEVVDFLPLKTLFQISPTYLSSSLDTKTIAKKDFDRWKRVFFQLKEKIEKDGNHLKIVYIPLEVEFDPSRYEVYENIGFKMNPKWLESDSEFVIDLVQLTKENQIPLIDLRQRMRYRTDLLQKGDIHLNEVATRLIAEILKKDIQ